MNQKEKEDMRDNMAAASIATVFAIGGFCLSYFVFGWSMVPSIIAGIASPFIILALLVAWFVIMLNWSAKD